MSCQQPIEHLRKKAVDAYDHGERKIHICRTLNISRNTLDLWLKRRKETGRVAANTQYRGVSIENQ
ncbi:helix-turn-helix domain-containing protein [Planktothricoides sp. FACHB-1370]|uniref:Helix-turn-helix domain-containing protein n=1 Tax=Planktothricoides raciborskii FACHB-1370 TaxID=2949576 RepID=A0ABR8EDF1_9CYAN|nr:helix-turn-helix domain-containing protein [Planktothricoides raciborskii FACHB-1370]MBD2583021.1 helix-turn-helix domain-containing protein [Planktothricoides raciborskii FACHB-1261]